MKREIQCLATYDNMFAEGGAGGVFDLLCCRSGFCGLFKAMAQQREEAPKASTQSTSDPSGAAPRKQLLEVGFGTSAIAHVVPNRDQLEHQGLDLSPMAVSKVRH